MTCHERNVHIAFVAVFDNNCKRTQGSKEFRGFSRVFITTGVAHKSKPLKLCSTPESNKLREINSVLLYPSLPEELK